MTWNGAKVMRRGETIFTPLASQAKRLIPGGCQCDWCKSHPNETPMWDTLAIDATSEHSNAWTVHYPEFSH